MNHIALPHPSHVPALLAKFNCSLKPVEQKIESERAAHPRKEPKTGPRKNRYITDETGERATTP